MRGFVGLVFLVTIVELTILLAGLVLGVAGFSILEDAVWR